jgi:hypothetical protein
MACGENGRAVKLLTARKFNRHSMQTVKELVRVMLQTWYRVVVVNYHGIS